jgi:NitT/TauT family transport system ATP-binding protein
MNVRPRAQPDTAPDDEMASGSPISIKGVSRSFEREGKRVVALSDISLEVTNGEFVAILGPSGCGKSTLLLLVAGLLRPSSGQIAIDGRQVVGPHTSLGFVFQDPNLLEWRTALRNITLQAEVRKMDKPAAHQRALELMRSTGLQGFEDSYPSELSGGMRQRVSICRAQLHDPPLLLMDEPFGALDALTREQMAVDLQSLWLANRNTVLFVTHDIAEAVFLADRVVVLSSRPGRVLDIFTVPLNRPRRLDTRQSPDFVALEGSIRGLLRADGVLMDSTH